jgi:redox-sensitive bicupin YhaK (pirin superfamily)
MLTLSPAKERGRTRIDWLDSRHTFSFGEWYDPGHMGFRALRVINDDRVAPGGGFPTHGHADMEILSYVLEGGLAHKDSMGTGSVIRPGDVQRMSAGTGVRHSEFNESSSSPVHFLQIWIIPDRRGHAPGYEQKSFPEGERHGKLRIVASPDGRDGSVSLHQDVALWAGVLDEGQKAELPLGAGRHAWIHVARGAATVNGKRLGEGDGAGLSDERLVTIEGHGGEVLVFDLA